MCKIERSITKEAVIETRRLLAILFVAGCLLSLSMFAPCVGDAWTAACAAMTRDKGMDAQLVCGFVGSGHTAEIGLAASLLGAGAFLTFGIGVAVGL